MHTSCIRVFAYELHTSFVYELRTSFGAPSPTSCIRVARGDGKISKITKRGPHCRRVEEASKSTIETEAPLREGGAKSIELLLGCRGLVFLLQALTGAAGTTLAAVPEKRCDQLAKGLRPRRGSLHCDSGRGMQKPWSRAMHPSWKRVGLTSSSGQAKLGGRRNKKWAFCASDQIIWSGETRRPLAQKSAP